MVSTFTVVFALSVFNLLLCTGGLLFVFFEWNAARRREYLYLYFNEERPGQEYFSAARRHRIQYTRLLWAFGTLCVRHFLSVFVAANLSSTDAFNSAWGGTLTLTASALLPWLGFLESLSLSLFIYALLLEWKPLGRDISAWLLGLLVVTAGFWATLTLVYETGMLGKSPGAENTIQWATALSRVGLGGLLFLALRARARERSPMGVFVLPIQTATLAFGAWVLFPTLGDVVATPVAYPLGHFFAFAILTSAFARSTLNDYETLEMSRHRLGRERSVIFTFIKRLGGAFTTDVEQILQIILESALETTEASAGAIYLFDGEKKRLLPRLVLNFFPPLYAEYQPGKSLRRTEELELSMRDQSFDLGEGIIGEVAKGGQGQLIEDVRAAGIMLGTTTEFMRNRSLVVVPLKVRDEVLGVLTVLNKQRGSFGSDDQSLLQGLADQASLSINNAMLTVEVAQQERIRRDLQIARDIQQQLLPDFCPNVPGFEIAARADSATEVGGDYYDFFWVDDDHLGILIADVSGKGVPAALVVAMIRSAFRAQAPGNTDVRDVLSRVNSFITGDLRSGMFVTCIYGILEVSTKRFSWGRAGHEPLLIAHRDGQNTIDVLSPDGFALGVVGAPDFAEWLQVETVELHPGDRVLLFTDGLTEAMNSQGEEFGMERILRIMGEDDGDPTHGNGDGSSKAVAQARVESELQNMKHLESAVQQHVGEAPQSDDLTIVFLAAK